MKSTEDNANRTKLSHTETNFQNPTNLPSTAQGLERLLFLAGLFSAILIGSNFMAVKLFDILGFTIPVAVILFPFCFVVSNIINEFYGLRTTRKVIVFTFIFNAVVIAFMSAASLIPTSKFAGVSNSTYNSVFLPIIQVLVGSITAYIVGGLLNAHVFDKIKRKGKALALRSAVSTFLGIVVDSTIFISIAFAGVLPINILLKTIFGHVIAKILFGVALGTPITIGVVKILKINKQSQKTSE